MKHDARLEIRMTSQRRRELDELADEAGLSAADVARLAIRRLLQARDVLLKLPIGEARRRVEASGNRSHQATVNASETTRQDSGRCRAGNLCRGRIGGDLQRVPKNGG